MMWACVSKPLNGLPRTSGKSGWWYIIFRMSEFLKLQFEGGVFCRFESISVFSTVEFEVGFSAFPSFLNSSFLIFSLLIYRWFFSKVLDFEALVFSFGMKVLRFNFKRKFTKYAHFNYAWFSSFFLKNWIPFVILYFWNSHKRAQQSI